MRKNLYVTMWVNTQILKFCNILTKIERFVFSLCLEVRLRQVYNANIATDYVKLNKERHEVECKH